MNDRHDSTPQIDAATAVRRLAHALVAHEGAGTLLARIADEAHRLAAELEQCPRLVRAADAMRTDRAGGPPPDGAPVEHFDRCPVSGSANPFATDLVARRVGDEVHCEVQLGPGCEGPPGHAHGGIIAALFDDATAFLTRVLDETCAASELTVHYRRPVPIGRPLQIDARVARREGRRIYTEATMHHGDTIVARCTCTKVIIES
ncbi:MAG: PaaI family thioesterase [Acidimicrobiales bacterium]